MPDAPGIGVTAPGVELDELPAAGRETGLLPLLRVAGDDLPDDEPAEAGSESAEEDFSAEAVAADPEDQDVDTAVEEALAAAQDAAAGRSSLLPVTGFKVAGHSGSQMQVRAMPEVFSQALRTTITEAAMKSVTPIPRQCDFTCPRAEKSILSSIGIIITQMSTPTGMLTFATSIAATDWKNPGSICPSTTPTTMHSATQTVR